MDIKKLKCGSCGFEEDNNNEFIGIFSAGSSFMTTEHDSCGIYGCPVCKTVTFTDDIDYLKNRKIKYKKKFK